MVFVIASCEQAELLFLVHLSLLYTYEMSVYFVRDQGKEVEAGFTKDIVGGEQIAFTVWIFLVTFIQS